MIRFLMVAGIFLSCTTPRSFKLPVRKNEAIGGTAFYKKIGSLKWNEREPKMRDELLSGNIPSFLRQFVPITIQFIDSAENKKIQATVFVTTDYLSIGSDQDFVRTPMTPMLAQLIADSLNCFLPTRKIVDEIYLNAAIKLEPAPLVEKRDSAATFYEHNMIIESQRKYRKGLIAGIKKDLVISSRLKEPGRNDRVAIYGWHKLNGTAIQPLYTGHINWYVDYSHGVRLINRIILINGKQYDYTEVLKNEKWRRLICDEPDCNFYRY